MGRTLFTNARLLDPATGLDATGGLAVSDGRIAAIYRDEDPTPQSGDQVFDLRGQWLVPGLVDLRCALREPGFEHKEDIHSGLRAAAAGGFTAVCATPDTSPVTDRAAVVVQVLDRARTANGARLLPVAAATKGLDDERMAPIGELVDMGCVAVSQGEEPIGSARLMRRILEYASGFDVPVFSSPIEPSLKGLCDEGPWSTRLGLSGSPAAAEVIAASRDITLAELTGGRLHLSRVSTGATLELVRAAKARGVPVTCDVTAHHLHLTTEALSGFDPNTRVWPPLRSAEDRDALRAGLADGTVDAVCTDHQPHHAEDKAREFSVALSGVSALETTLSLVMDLVSQGAVDALRAIDLLSSGPSRVLGRDGFEFTEGAVADLTVIDPEGAWCVGRDTLKSRGTNTPFLGRNLKGQATMTMVDGVMVHQLTDGSPAS
ncbi:MAG: dihydroorotase [Myxococcota bacterium]|nr:dihydroorotase [Myxococcota bacterium]MEE2779033.1 dihydroorotase [Myxococcota bacterium]